MSENAAIGEMLLTPKETAKTLKISPRTLWSLTASNEIPCVRVGRRSVRYTPADLADYIDRQRSIPAR